ncbi:uromodulin-like 1 [Amia ocellicauda]|uniref:uromodulin-like 1 n=1 Tax=Amia ocellicauda TaxID=2972642 RepID=UPI003464BD50
MGKPHARNRQPDYAQAHLQQRHCRVATEREKEKEITSELHTLGHNTLFDGYDLSLSGYHLCTQKVTQTTSNVVAYKASYTERVSCGGWLPWKTCQRTVYKTAYRTMHVKVTKDSTSCCEGYEQVGSYCALPLNRSMEFTSKPGSCPENGTAMSSSRCEWDMDCPGWEKCCRVGGGSYCITPHTGERGWSFNVTITVKTDYQQLHALEKGLLNHTRLIYSMVTGVLKSLDTSVYHIHSYDAGPFKTASQLLLRVGQPTSLHTVTTELQPILRSIEEVSNVEVQDTNECAHAELNSCSTDALCLNTDGSYSCVCRPGFTDPSPNSTGTVCIAPAPIINLVVLNVTSSGFSVRWSVDSSAGQEFELQLLRDLIIVISEKIQLTTWAATGLEPGVMYTVRVVSMSCGNESDAVFQDVKTAAQALEAETRITNVQFTEALRNTSSAEYLNLTQEIQKEIRKSLAADIGALIDSGNVRIVIWNLTSGSVRVKFILLFSTDMREDILNISRAVLNALKDSSKYVVDSNSTSIVDFDECASGDEDCSAHALCHNTWGSFNCSCKDAFTDTNPHWPGHSCEALAPAITVMSTSPETETLVNMVTTHSLEDKRETSSAPVISQEDAITVDCRIFEISVTVAKAFLTSKSIAISSLYLGKMECNVSSVTETHVRLRVLWDNCDTQLLQNHTHTYAGTTLFNDRTSTSLIAPKVNLEIPVKCFYSNSFLISTGYAPTGVDMIQDIIEGSGSFLATIQLLNGTDPFPKNYTLSPDEEVFIEVGINSTTPQVKLIVNECWATPTSSASDPTKYKFMENSCPTANTSTRVIENGNSTRARLALRIFSFVDHSVIYLHCQVHICIDNSSTNSNCKPGCNLRSVRSTQSIGIGKASCGPIFRKQEAPSQDKGSSYYQTGFIILGVVLCLLLLVAGASAVFFYKKYIGHYDFSFKPKQENFTYHVFNT